jgi:hypothetical protein
MSNEIEAFHAAGRMRLFPNNSDIFRFVGRTIVTASSRFIRASSSVSPCACSRQATHPRTRYSLPALSCKQPSVAVRHRTFTKTSAIATVAQTVPVPASFGPPFRSVSRLRLEFHSQVESQLSGRVQLAVFVRTQYTPVVGTGQGEVGIGQSDVIEHIDELER